MADPTPEESEAAAALAAESEAAAAALAAKNDKPESWRDALPEEIRDDANFAKYSTLDSFAKGHLNAVSQLGKDRIVMPQSDDEWSDVFNKLGRPDTSGGYKLPEMEVEESVKEYVAARVESFKEVSHKLGLSNDQASALHGWFLEGNNEKAVADSDAAKVSLADADTALKAEWGNAYDSNLLASKNALAEFGSEELVDYLETTGMGNNPHVLRAFQKIGIAMLGDKALEGGPGDTTPEQANEKISTIMAKPEYWDANSLERPGLVREVAKLMEQAHPNQNK